MYTWIDRRSRSMSVSSAPNSSSWPLFVNSFNTFNMTILFFAYHIHTSSLDLVTLFVKCYVACCCAAVPSLTTLATMQCQNTLFSEAQMSWVGLTLLFYSADIQIFQFLAPSRSPPPLPQRKLKVAKFRINVPTKILEISQVLTDKSCVLACFMSHNVQGGPKNRTCLSVDNSAMVTRRKACDMTKVLDKKGQTCITNRLNILCLICINLHYPWN